MKQYAIKAADGTYFAGYVAGTALFDKKCAAIVFPATKEAENFIIALSKGGLHIPLTVTAL